MKLLKADYQVKQNKHDKTLLTIKKKKNKTQQAPARRTTKKE